MAQKIYEGKNLRMYVDDGGTPKLIAHEKSFSIDLSVEFKERITKDTVDGVELIPGKFSWSGSGSALLVTDDASYTADDIIASMIAKEKLSVTFGTTVTGEIEFTGDIYLESSTINADVEDDAAVDYSFKGTGALTKGVKSA